MSAQNPDKAEDQQSPPSLRAISVAGFKSIGERQRIEIRPLTLLAGANSGGKSSLIQPMLLLKQTLEAPYDPGSLLLDGPNVRFTSADQFLTKTLEPNHEGGLIVEFEVGNLRIELCFKKTSDHGLEIQKNRISKHGKPDVVLEPTLDSHKIKDILSSIGFVEPFLNKDFFVVRDRSFLTVGILFDKNKLKLPFMDMVFGSEGSGLLSLLEGFIHLPGLRGNPRRTYQTTAVGDVFPGTFEVYVASIIYGWQIANNKSLNTLKKYLKLLGLTCEVSAKRLDDTQVELKVGRLLHSRTDDSDDLVSIADVGFGVSQTLPVLVALLTANPGQVVYLEQPEIHLHPRAQLALAKVLAEAAQRGVIVIAETHSALLLQGVQTLVAKDELSADLVKLHWVQRDEKGMTKVHSHDLDSTGAFGDWPMDFMDVALDADNEYLSAAEAKLLRKSK